MSVILLLGFLYWSSMISDAWPMTSSEWELYVAANLNVKHLKGVSKFLLILEKKTGYLLDFKGKKNSYS